MNHLTRIITTASIVLAALAAKADNILSIRDTITDPSIVFPESFEADTHALMQNWYLQNYAVIDRNVDNSTDVSATDAQLTERLMAMPTEVEMPFNNVVRSYIDMYTQRRRALVESMLGMSLYYMPIFEEALEREGVPLELKYLPIIESALNPDAVSRAGATGLWQFMLQTGRGLGLEINTLVDERRDPLRSSEAAAKYLHQLYDIYNDWSLAIAAYNCGPGNINKALRRASDDGLSGKKDFWAIYRYLPQETRGYLPGFIAANYVMNYYDKHNISPALARQPILMDTVHVNRRIHLQQVADVLDIPIERLRLLNPQYRKDIIPGDSHTYVLTLPSHQALSYVISEDSIASHNAALYARRDVVEPNDGSSPTISDDGRYIITEETIYHKVKRGDTFSSLAQRYGTTVASIKRVNGITTLRRGRTIKIVVTKRTPRPVEEVTLPTDSIETSVDDVITEMPDGAENVVSEGAEEAAVEETTDEADDAEADEEVAGEAVETVAEPEPTPAPEVQQQVQPAQPRQQQPQPVYYRVRQGDTLSKIARHNGTTVDKLKRLNPSINPSKISVGQRIRIK